MKGIIKTLKDTGFGFISQDGAEAGAKEIFFHSENVVGTTFNELHEGDQVTFDLQSGPKGPFAADVQLVSADAQEAAPEATEAA